MAVYILPFFVRNNIAYHVTLSSGKAYIVLCALLGHCLLAGCSTSVGSKTTRESVCVGDTVTLKCSVKGLGTTVWKGNGLDCGELPLLHSRYNISTMYSCSDGDVIAHAESLSAENDYYTSQINVTITSKFIGPRVTIMCFYDDGTMEAIVANHILTIENSEESSVCTNLTVNVSDHEIDMTGIHFYLWMLFFHLLYY